MPAKFPLITRNALLRVFAIVVVVWVCVSIVFLTNNRKNSPNIPPVTPPALNFEQVRMPDVQVENRQEVEQQQPVQTMEETYEGILSQEYNSESYDASNLLPCLVSEVRSRGLLDTRLAKPVRIYDGFTFNDEFDMLEIRLNELHKVVDYFIIVEAPWTLQNTPKPLYFQQNKDRFKKFEKQIIHVIVNTKYENFKYWENESYYRSAVGTIAIKKLLGGKIHETDQVITVGDVPAPTDNDLITVFDVDEFPDADLLYMLKWHELPNNIRMIQIAMRWTYYGYQWDNGSTWKKCGIFPFRTLKEFGFDSMKTNEVRFSCLKSGGPSLIVIGDMNCYAGWHCSWCIHPRSYKTKIESFAHKEYMEQLKIWNRDYKDEKVIWWFIKDGMFIGSTKDRGKKISVETMRSTMPQKRMIPRYALSNIQSYPFLVYPDPAVKSPFD